METPIVKSCIQKMSTSECKIHQIRKKFKNGQLNGVSTLSSDWQAVVFHKRDKDLLNWKEEHGVEISYYNC